MAGATCCVRAHFRTHFRAHNAPLGTTSCSAASQWRRPGNKLCVSGWSPLEPAAQAPGSGNNFSERRPVRADSEESSLTGIVGGGSRPKSWKSSSEHANRPTRPAPTSAAAAMAESTARGRRTGALVQAGRRQKSARSRKGPSTMTNARTENVLANTQDTAVSRALAPLLDWRQRNVIRWGDRSRFNPTLVPHLGRARLAAGMAAAVSTHMTSAAPPPPEHIRFSRRRSSSYGTIEAFLFATPARGPLEAINGRRQDANDEKASALGCVQRFVQLQIIVAVVVAVVAVVVVLESNHI
jgi:hypothetical protein